MQIRIFSINSNASVEEQEEMNKFLRGNRIIEVRQNYDETRGIWTYSISYIESSGSAALSQQRPEKIDYKNVLSPQAFEVFSKLREQRKLIAKDESVPAYAIFTDKELASMAELAELSVSGIQEIEGINKGRAERYGIRLLDGMQKEG